MYTTPSYAAPYYNAASANNEAYIRDLENQKQLALVQELRLRAELERERSANRIESARPPSAPAPQQANGSPQFAMGTSLLTDSIRGLDDADVWMDYLKPDQVARAMEAGDKTSLNRLAMAFTGVAANPKLARISSLPGFNETMQTLGSFLEPGTNAPAPISNPSTEPVRYGSPTPAAEPSPAVIEQGTHSILETEGDLSAADKEQARDSAAEEIELPAPLPLNAPQIVENAEEV